MGNWVSRTMWWEERSAELSFSNLDPAGYNYVIQHVEISTNRQVITLLPGNQLGVTTWQPLQEEETPREKKFKIEKCSDHPEEWILTAYNREPEIQWVVNNSTLEAKVYPGDERPRPPYNWRFRLEEVGRQGSKKYFIISHYEDLNGNNCLCLRVSQNGTESETTGRELGFAAKDENDRSQIWCLYQQ